MSRTRSRRSRRSSRATTDGSMNLNIDDTEAMSKSDDGTNDIAVDALNSPPNPISQATQETSNISEKCLSHRGYGSSQTPQKVVDKSAKSGHAPVDNDVKQAEHIPVDAEVSGRSKKQFSLVEPASYYSKRSVVFFEPETDLQEKSTNRASMTVMPKEDSKARCRCSIQ